MKQETLDVRGDDANRGTDVVCPWCGEQQDIHVTIDDGDELECEDCGGRFGVQVEMIYETFKIGDETEYEGVE